MSREHPQLRVRIPPELKDALEAQANAFGRTLTAEIVNRLEASLRREEMLTDLIPAERAKELSKITREQLPQLIVGRAISSINHSISMGQTNNWVDLSDLELEHLTDEQFEEVMQPIQQRLAEAGYTIRNVDGDGISIEF